MKSVRPLRIFKYLKEFRFGDFMVKVMENPVRGFKKVT